MTNAELLAKIQSGEETFFGAKWERMTPLLQEALIATLSTETEEED